MIDDSTQKIEFRGMINIKPQKTNEAPTGPITLSKAYTQHALPMKGPQTMFQSKTTRDELVAKAGHTRNASGINDSVSFFTKLGEFFGGGAKEETKEEDNPEDQQ